ncbi:MAG TPA: M20/M25/M40 family metallo-hydrolase, partial [Gemmatimonadaceae bacterium]
MTTLRSAVRATAIAASALLVASVVGAQAPAPADPTATLLTELIRLNTSNPPGNEDIIGQFLAPKFKALGFETWIIPTPQPGKSHFIARLRGDGSKKPILLAAHEDVVGVEREKWTVDPFAGVIKDGYVFGRGAIDFKGGMAVFVRAAMMLAERKVPLARDVIFMAEADEEGAPLNTSWLAKDHWSLMDCEFALNEGGWIIKRENGSVRYVSISTADKSSVSFTLTARGTSTHSSMPRPDNAIFALSKALAKLADYDPEVQLTPSTRQFFTTLGKTSQPPMSGYFADLVSGDPARVKRGDAEISKDPLLHSIMRNTIAPVIMNAGFRSNVIPGSAEAQINVRTIPGTDPRDIAAMLKRVIADDRIEVKQLAGPGAARPDAAAPPALVSSEDTDLYRALVKEAKAQYPGAEVTSYLFQAGTDAGAWRSRGIPVYGIYPYAIDNEDLSRMHGNDERVSIESLRQGTEMIYRTLVSVAAKK